MTIVRVHPRHARELIGECESGASRIDRAIGPLSPLVSEALRLLDQPVRPMNDPMAKLAECAIELRKGSDDLAWRLELIETGDSRSMGEHKVLDVNYLNSWIDNGDVTLTEALIGSGLTPAQADAVSYTHLTLPTTPYV